MKILAAYLVLLLSCVYLTECKYTKLTVLIEPENDQQQVISDILKNEATKIGFEVETVEITKSNVIYTIKAAENHTNVINLRTTDLCDVKSFKAFQKSKLLCISDLDILDIHNQTSYYCTETQNTFSNGTKAEPVSQIEQTLTPHNKSESYCNTDDNDFYHVLVHEDVMQYDRLLQVLLNLENNKYEIKDKVVLCVPHILNQNTIRNKVERKFKHLSIEQRRDCTDGMQIDNNIIAILSHTPLEIETNIPIIYYGTPNLSEENGLYLNLLKSLKPLKYAFLHFIKYMEWSRVAVLSDDSDSSEEFLNELLPLLKEEDIVYTDQCCNGKTCNFTDALTLLRNARATIIILNVDKRNMAHAIAQMNAAQIKYTYWIMRDWPFTTNMALKTTMYSITLYPVFRDNNEMDSYPFLSAIIYGLKILELQYKDALGVRDAFIRRMKNVKSQDYSVYALVTRNNHDVGTMMIEDKKVKKNNLSLTYKPLDLVEECILRRADYFKPCNDKTILLFLTILTAFLLLMYVIMLFFRRYKEPRYGRMIESS